MTDSNTETPAQPAIDTAAADPATAPGGTANKAFWAGIGVGSAALVAALMSTTRSRRKK